LLLTVDAEAVTINGLPLHPLVVHFTVVTLPVTAVFAIFYVVRSMRPDMRGHTPGDKLRLPLMVLGIVCAALVWLTVASGTNLRDAMGLSAPFVHKHQQWAHRLEWTTFGFAIVTVLVGFTDQRSGWLRGLLHALLVVGGVAIIVLCVLTGEAGARMVYPPALIGH
jgi:uncharacterized membrane protein